MRISVLQFLLLLPLSGAPGIVWHEPAFEQPEIGGVTMRSPAYEPLAGDTIIYQGFAKDGGANGNQTGGEVFYRYTPEGGSPGAWSSELLGFSSDAPGGNQYWEAALPFDTAGATDVVEYYIRVDFDGSSGTNPETTYLFGGDLQGNTSVTTAEGDAQAAPFSIRNRPGWIFHANNRVIADDDIQVRVKTGYIGPANDPATLWSSAGAVYFTTDGSTPTGSLGVASGTSTSVALVFDGVEQDNSGNGNAALWRATLAGVLDGLPLGGEVKYKIGLWNSATNEEKFADHTAGTDDETFTYQNGVIGEPSLTIDGLNANYTTTKLFIDEVVGESIPLAIVFQPGESNVTEAEVFTNLNRRDRAEIDGDGDGYPDGISGIDRDSLVAWDDGHYYKAWPMVSAGAGVYTLDLDATKTGAYRLTARWKVVGDSAWRYYTNGAANRRDHAITISPRDARDIVLYEINVLNIEASGNTFADRSTIEDMHNAVGAPHNGSNRWDLDYLKALGANWLWFQPIHPNGYDGREPVNGYGSGSALYDPGSPYAVKNFFEVNPIFTKEFTGDPLNPVETGSPANRALAMTAWQNFVAAADGKEVGIMLDAPFNHTSFDVELAQTGVDLLEPDGSTWSPSDEIRNRDARFFSRDGNYGDRAFDAGSIAAGPDRFDFGKWNDVKDVYFGRYDSLVEFDSEPERSSYTSEGDWFDPTDTDWTNVDFMKGGAPQNITRWVWKYFAEYAIHWLEKTRPAGENRNSETEAGLSLEQRYEWDAKGIDGLRCDFGQGLPPQCWEYIINVARSKKWNFVMMSESLDGGAVTYRSNRHFDILNENIVFPLKSASTKYDYRNIFEGRRAAYGQGLVLANTTSHDEENYDDPWQAVVRFGVSSTLAGVPMIFPGQELGVSRTTGYDEYETNFGKLIPHFKRYNSMMPIWNDTDFGNDQLFKVYSGMATARQESEALRSSNRWFLDGNGDNSQIHAVAKYEQAGASPAHADVMLAFSNLDRDNVQSDTFVIPPTLASEMGLKSNRKYNVRNRAAYENAAAGMTGRRDAWLWPGDGYTGTELQSGGFFVSLSKVPTSGSSDASPGGWGTDPFEGLYLKVYDVTPPVSPGAVSSEWALGSTGLFTWSDPVDPDDRVVSYFVEVLNPLDQVITSGTVSDGSNQFEFMGVAGTAYTARVTAMSVAGVAGDPVESTQSILLLAEGGDEDGDGQTNLDESVALTDPLDASSVFRAEDANVVGGDIVVSFSSVEGLTYQLQTSVTLDSESWTTVATGPATGGSTQLTHVGGAGEDRRFYRVRVVE